MHGRPGHHVAQRSEPHVDIGMLQQELDRDREAEKDADLERHAHQDQGRSPGERLHGLVHRMLHEAVEAVHPLY